LPITIEDHFLSTITGGTTIKDALSEFTKEGTRFSMFERDEGGYYNSC